MRAAAEDLSLRIPDLLRAAADRYPSKVALTFAGGELAEKNYCGDMSSCEEAYRYFTQGGLARLDGDGDGIRASHSAGNKRSAKPSYR